MKERLATRCSAFRSSLLYLALRAHWILVLTISLNMIAQSVLTLVQPWSVRNMIDHIVENPTHGQNMEVKYDLLRFIGSTVEQFFHSNDFEFLYRGIFALLIIYVSTAVLLYFQNIALARLGQQVMLHIRKNLLSQMIARLNPMEIGAAELPDAVESPSFHGNVEWKGVAFGYRPSRPILQDFNLSVPQGQKVALVGDSGSGKSTALQLLMRLYDPQQGEIRIDRVDIRSFKLASLRSQMAIVLQDSFIFNMSIAENIAIARPGATQAEIVESAKAAEADDFIRALPQGYETMLGERGAGLSGGQKRRLAMWRVPFCEMLRSSFWTSLPRNWMPHRNRR